MNEKLRVARFAGFQDGLNEELSNVTQDYDQAIDKAENIYIAHGDDAVQAAREETDRAVAREAADDYIRLNVMKEENPS